MLVKTNIHIPMGGGPKYEVIPPYSGQYKYKIGRGSDLEMKKALMKLELEVIADPKGTGGESVTS